MRVFEFKSAWGRVLFLIGLVALSFAMLLAITFLTINVAMVDSTAELVLDVSELPSGGVDCVIVLGAGLQSDGTPSHMLEDRLKIGIEAMNATGAVILMSGDNSGENYNEPLAMKKYAMEHGVEESRILLDGQGYSTYDSITRLVDEWGFDNVVIITQEYHLYRALYIADHSDVEAVGVSADLRPYTRQIFREIREFVARVKDFYWCE
jgi:vancomycin permeability regulator SanA